MKAVAIGFGLGFLVALQLGPLSLFLVRSTLRGGLRLGLAVGAGIALVDTAYAAAGSAGAAALLQVEQVRLVLGLAGAVVLVWLGGRTLLSASQPVPREAALPPGSARRTFLVSVAATAANPATIVSWTAIFSAAVAGADARPALLVLGVALGSSAQVTALALLVAIARRGISAAVQRGADLVAGCGLVAFGVALGVRTAA